MRRAIWKRVVTLLVAALVILPAMPAQAQGGADLSITLKWLGKGLPRAKVGQTVSYAFTLTNLGPKDATDISVETDGSDHFDAVVHEFYYETIAAGGSVTDTFTAYVCCFPKGETRDAFVDSDVYPDTPDPNLENNSATVGTKIIGPHN